jgi:hypothetical protein
MKLEIYDIMISIAASKMTINIFVIWKSKK